MRINQFIFTCSCFCYSFSLTAQFTDVINSNRPGESMSAFSVGKTVIQAESGGYYTQEKFDNDTSTTGWGIDFAVRYGAILEQLEFIAEGQYQNDRFTSQLEQEQRKGLKQLVTGAKFLLYDPNRDYEAKPNLYSWKANHRFKWRDLLPSVGIYGGLNFNLNSSFAPEEEPTISPKVMLITQNQFKRSVLVMNFIADKVATVSMTVGYIATLTYGINSRFSAFAENQSYWGDLYEDTILRVGAAYLLWENIQVDLSAGVNFKNSPSQLVAGAGVSWRFDSNYEEVYLRIPTENKGGKADKSKKEKEKKKRKDGFNPDNLETK